MDQTITAISTKCIAVLVALVGAACSGPERTVEAQPPIIVEADTVEEKEEPVRSASFQALELAAIPPSHARPKGAPAAVAFIPEAFDTSAPFDVVIFIHGWNGCVRVLMMGGAISCINRGEPETDGWNLGHILSAPQRIILAPQLSFRRRSGDAGAFDDPDYVAQWRAAALTELDIGEPTRTVLMAHSAGFETALAWTHSDTPVHAVLLMDALYARAPNFAEWLIADEHRQLVSIATGGSTARQQRRLRRLIERSGATTRLRAETTSAQHASVPSAEGPRVLNEILRRIPIANGYEGSDANIEVCE